LFEFNKINTHEYNLYLCNLDKSIICTLDYISIQYDSNFQGYNQLSFEVPLTDNGWLQSENQFFNYLQPLYLILMEVKNNDELVFQEFFIVDSPSFTFDNGVTKKNIKCYSSDYIFNNFYLNSYEEVKLLYDPSGNDGILNTMLNQMENVWSVNYVSLTLLNVYHSFNFSSSTFRSVIESLSEQYNCFFIFDTVNDQINIYDTSGEGYGESSDIVISDENFLKSLSAEVKASEMVTKLKVWGKDNITIAKFNPLGLLEIYDYSWAQQNNRMSQYLSYAYTTWKTLVSNNEGVFQDYLDTLDTFNASLLIAQNELTDLNTALETINDSLDVLIDTHRRNTSSYDTIYADKVSVLSEISSKESEIISLESQIDTVNNNISSLHTLLSLENNFTLEQRQQLSKLTIEGTLKLDSVSDELQLYNYAKSYQQIKNKPSIDSTLDIVDLFSISDSYIESKYDKIKVGNYIYLDCQQLGFNYEQYRITQIIHDKLNNNLSITISNKDKLNTEIYYLNRIFTASSEAADTLTTKQEDYSKYTTEANKILYNDSTINTETNEIIVGDNIINKRGFTGNSLGTRNGSIKIQGDQIVFSPDGDFETYYALLSADGLYLENNTTTSRIVITPEYGIQIDQNVGTSESPSWDNIFYVDSITGNVILDGGYLHLLTKDNKKQIYIDPENGIKFQKDITYNDDIIYYKDDICYYAINTYICINDNNGIGIDNILPTNTSYWQSITSYNSVEPNFDNKFYVDTEGDLNLEGILRTGKFDRARLEINKNGFSGYNSSNNLHGIVIDKSTSNQFADINIYSDGYNYFTIYYGVPSVVFKANGISFLSSYNGNTIAEGVWHYNDSEIANQDDINSVKDWVNANFIPIPEEE